VTPDHAADPATLRATYDAQLREQAEMASASRVDRQGPLWQGKFGDRGMISYRSLDGLTGERLDALIAGALAHFAADPVITSLEWKTRGHDAPPDLGERLVRHGFVAQAPETVMMGEARRLLAAVPLPRGVTVRRIDDQADPYPELLRAAQAQAAAFGVAQNVEEWVRRLKHHPEQVEFWVVDTPGGIACVGRLEIVQGTTCAGLWGGGTRPEWRGQGLYRALTAARAQSAVQRGVQYLYSDCSPDSRPILERSGLQPVTTTTPYLWTR
jgi:N-acetylglutamate synthase-like GNAT family acetyltransferase